MNRQKSQYDRKKPFSVKIGKQASWKRWGILGFSVLLLLLAGWGYQMIGTTIDAQAYPPPGKLVEVGGYRLHIDCTGKGSPTVILDAGLGVSSLIWSRVQPEVARFTRVCSYDRAGLGWSDPGPTSQTSQQIVTALHTTLLTRAQVTGPFILVGHSFGGLNMRLYASEYRQDTAGLILVDAPDEGKPLAVSPVTHQVINICHALAQVGIMRLAGLINLYPDDLGTYDSSVLPMVKALMVLPKYFTATYEEQAGYAVSEAEVHAHRYSLGHLPLIVLTAGRSDFSDAVSLHQEQLWQNRLARFLSSNSKQVIASKSGHVIQFYQPELLVKAITQVLYVAQHGGNLSYLKRLV
ncbi:alpha/beta hydrolase [Ktedonosporobacter rubrisoli]|uniref:Alpha/beta hydrolase n=1 Tax=Ktedonosporobacter rubrisoli TaxID=2509675 RepID=A0A4P6JJ53_KTERU|nr:alpha/beta hydrolase [Ktedonosporobacter rubrisoli]QBD74942.1 alpha/beta hydrolase [Ktedonosporobacter rubrisoli]